MAGHDTRVGLLGVLTALTSSLACENDDDPCAGVAVDLPPEPALNPSGSPTVIAGEWIGGGSVLELQFSRPIHSIGDLDPSRFAIVGWDATGASYYYDADECRPQTRYNEVGGGGYYYSYSPATVADAWIGPEDPTRLRLRPATAGAQCRTSTNSRAAGVFLVYTDRPDAGPRLLDDDGDEVLDIGPQWAIDRKEECTENYYCAVGGYASGILPRLSTLIDIPCP